MFGERAKVQRPAIACVGIADDRGGVESMSHLCSPFHAPPLRAIFAAL
jgi:hypothetical protein